MNPDLQLLRRVILSPDVQHLVLLEPLLWFLQYLFWAFVGVVLISTLLAVALRRAHPALAEDLARVVPGRVGPWLALGLLPLASLAILFGQLVQGTPFAIADAILAVSPAVLVGLAAGVLYRRWPRADHGWVPLLLGAVTVLSLLAFLAPYQQLMTQLAWPELWPLVNPLVPDIYNIQTLVRLLIFLVTALVATGAVLLFVYQVWPERRLAADCPHGLLLARLALVLVLLGSLGLPALVVWESAILPVGARAAAGLQWAGAVVAAAWLTALLALGRLLRLEGGRLLVLCLLAAVLLGLELGRQQSVCTTAMADHLAVLETTAAAAFAEAREQQESRYPSNQPLSPEAGEKIYQDRCLACHSWETRVVGPPHLPVLPKYRDDADRLAEFIRNPAKVDPNYPAMPKTGLTRREARAVAEYLLEELQEKSR